VQEEERGAVASAPVEEPTGAAALHIVVLPERGSENNRDSTRGMISASWARLRRAVRLPREARGHQGVLGRIWGASIICWPQVHP